MEDGKWGEREGRVRGEGGGRREGREKMEAGREGQKGRDEVEGGKWEGREGREE